MVINLLHFISSYFLLFPRIGTFQRVTSEGNRKIRPAFRPRAEVVVRNDVKQPRTGLNTPAGRADSASKNMSSRSFCFCQAESTEKIWLLKKLALLALADAGPAPMMAALRRPSTPLGFATAIGPD
jgi:hypothetical protein